MSIPSSLAVVVSAVGLGALVWRFACHFIVVPWPYWLAWVLKNPYMLAFCHPHTIVKRIHKSGSKVWG